MVGCQYLSKVEETSKKVGQERRTIYKLCCDVRRFLEIRCNCGHGGDTIKVITQQSCGKNRQTTIFGSITGIETHIRQFIMGLIWPNNWHMLNLQQHSCSANYRPFQTGDWTNLLESTSTGSDSRDGGKYCFSICAFTTRSGNATKVFFRSCCGYCINKKYLKRNVEIEPQTSAAGGDASPLSDRTCNIAVNCCGTSKILV